MSVRAWTRQGLVEGEQQGRQLSFRGIPFAKPPLGLLRFRPPEPPEPWRGTRDARSYPAAAMQGKSDILGMAAAPPHSEDCLYLSVDTPAVDGRRRPVMVFIHGGAFMFGSASSPLYDGRGLCARGDVVLVRLSYRLGALGYLCLTEHGGERIGATANAGQLDQVAALRWVRDNIDAFGGDPDNVTVFGESAGSFSVCTLLVMPEAQGLFRRAIAQSGAALHLHECAYGAEFAGKLLSELGIGKANLDALHRLPAERIVEAQMAISPRLPDRSFFPVRDGEVVPLQPDVAIASGLAARVPLVIGTNRDEVHLFAIPLLRELDEPLAEEEAAALLAVDLPGHVRQPQLGRERALELLAVYRESRRALGLRHGNRALLAAIHTDLRFRIPSIRFAEAYCSHQPATFMYLFAYESPAMRGVLGSCHALELAFVFGTLDAPYQDRFAGRGEVVERLSARMMDAWLAHARSGDPSCEDAYWPAYEPLRRPTMVFDRESALLDAPFDAERAAWDDLL